MPETARARGDKLRYVAPSGALIEEIDWPINLFNERARRRDIA